MPDRRWTCSGCQVTVRFAAGHDAPTHPSAWSLVDGAWRCLVCRRELVAEQALAAAGVDTDQVEARAIRRRALVDFEVQRDPDQGNAAVAKVAGCTPHTVEQHRRELAAAGVIESPLASRECPVCGAEFEPKSRKRVFCSKRCAHVARQQKAKDARRDSPRVAAKGEAS